MKLDVYDPTNTTLQGTLSEPFDIGFVDDLLSLPMATFKVDVASSADIALLQPRRAVRFRTGATAGSGDIATPFVVQDTPASTGGVELEDGENAATVTFQCPGYAAILGYREGGAALWPFGAGTDPTVIAGRQQNPRIFGPYAPDFDDSGWAAATPLGPLSTEGWPDDQATKFSFTNRALFRRTVSADDSEGAARMYAVADWRTRLVVYRNGVKLFEKPAGETGLFYKDVEYDGEGETIVLDVERNQPGAGAVGWSWMRLETSTDDDGNETQTVGTALRRTFDPADFPGASSTWKVLDDYSSYPGVNVGYVMDLALQEAQDRGHFPLPGWDFDGDGDSGSNGWDIAFARQFDVQKLGRLLDELTSIEGEPEMTPAGTLRLWKRRGQDRSASVTIAAPHGLALSGRGPQATRWAYETQDGWGVAVNSAAETDLGVRMEEVVQLGNDLKPAAISDALGRQLTEDGKVLDEIEVDLPADVEPYVDVFLGDTVNVGARDGGTQTARITSFRLNLRTAGDRQWTCRLVPYTEAA